MEQISLNNQKQSFSKEAYNIQLTNCIGQSSVKTYCCSQNCKKNPFLCQNSKCICLKQHYNCSFVDSQNLLSKILSKKKNIPKNQYPMFDFIQKIYQSCIERLSRDRQSLHLWKQNYGFSSLQSKFLQCIKNNDTSQLNGNLIYKLKEQLNKNQDLYEMNINYFETKWKSSQKQFKKIFNKIGNNFIGYGLSIKQLQLWKAQRQQNNLINFSNKYNLKPIDQWVYKSNKDLILMQKLNISNKKIDRVIWLDCLINLKQLNLGGNSIQKIENLQKLKELKILSLTMNNIKKIQNLQKLKKLQELYLRNNKILKIENLLCLDSIQKIFIGFNPAIIDAKKDRIIQQAGTIQTLKKRGVLVDYKA